MRYEKNKIVYEVGDWVKVGNSNDYHKFLEPGDVFMIESVQQMSRPASLKLGYRGYAIHSDSVTPASQEEIDKATEEEKIMVGEYRVRFLGDDNLRDSKCYYIEVGCAKISKELFLKIGKKAGWL